MKAYSQDLRDRVIALRGKGVRAEDVSKRLAVSKRFVERCWSRYANLGESVSYKIGGHRVCILDKHRREIAAWIKEDANITLESLCDRCKKELGIKMSLVGIWKFLDKIGQPLKKNSARQRAR